MRRLGIGYGVMAAACVALLIWLAYHEFIEEPAAFAARGVPDLHGNTAPELSTVCFLGVMPLLLCAGWWWTRRVLAPLNELTRAAAQIESNNLRLPFQRRMNNDEVDQLAAVFGLMTERLEGSFQQIREFTLHASHELKTPLTVMRSQLETALRESASVPHEQLEWMHNLLDEVQRLVRIVDSLTLLSKADAGLLKLDRKPVHLDELVGEAFEDARVLGQPANLNVALAECARLEVLGDRDRLRQLLLILIDNAVKYNEPNGHLDIALRARDHSAEFQITNDGRLAPETQRRLFRRFVRGENAVGKVEGCGLGLTIAQWIVRAHDGTIELRAEPPGKISCIVHLPLAPIRASQQGLHEQSTSGRSA